MSEGDTPHAAPSPEVMATIRQVGMRFGDLFRDPRDGSTSVIKSIAMASWLVVTFITFWESYYHSISSWDLLLYAMTSQVCASGPLASHVISLTQPRLSGQAGKYAQPTPPKEEESK